MLSGSYPSVGYGQQLAHARCERNFIRLAALHQALIQNPDHRVVAAGQQRPHVGYGAYPRPSALEGSLASHGSTVPVDGRHADQSGNLLPVQHTQFRQVCQQCRGYLPAHAGNGVQQVILFTLQRTSAKQIPKFLVQVVQLLP